MVAFSKMIAAGFVASFGVAGVSAKLNLGSVSDLGLATEPSIKKHEPAVKGLEVEESMIMPQHMNQEELIKQNIIRGEFMDMIRNPEELKEMEENMKWEMKRLMTESEIEIEQMKHATPDSELVEQQYEAELKALQSELDRVDRIDEKDEYGNYLTVDTSKIQELKTKIEEYVWDPAKRKQEIATQLKDVAGLMGAQLEATSVLQETLETAAELSEREGEGKAKLSDAEVEAVKEQIKEKLPGLLDHMNAATQQMMSHMSFEDNEKLREVVQKMKDTPQAGMMGAVANMLEKVIDGQPLTMEYMEEGTREMMQELKQQVEGLNEQGVAPEPEF